MKFISILLSIYFLSISILPCADGDDAHPDSKIELSSTHHSDSCPDGMECSPFCACACCGCVGFNIPFAQSFNYISFSFLEINNFYTATYFVAGSLASIWQPPRLG